MKKLFFLMLTMVSSCSFAMGKKTIADRQKDFYFLRPFPVFRVAEDNEVLEGEANEWSEERVYTHTASIDRLFKLMHTMLGGGTDNKGMNRATLSEVYPISKKELEEELPANIQKVSKFSKNSICIWLDKLTQTPFYREYDEQNYSDELDAYQNELEKQGYTVRSLEAERDLQKQITAWTLKHAFGYGSLLMVGGGICLLMQKYKIIPTP